MKAPPLVHVVKSKRRLAVLATEEINNLFAHEPKFNVEGFPYRVLHHGQYETALLQRLGYPVSSPMREYYNYPRPPGKEPFETQKVTCDLMTLNPRAYVLNDMGCTDATTEYLSPTGWVRMDAYTGGKVAQYHPTSGNIEFVEPTEYVKRPCSEMIRFKTTRGVDQLLSPEHRVLLDNGLVVSAENIEQTYGDARTRRLFKFRTTFNVVGTPGINLTDAQIRVQVAVNADGHETGNRVHVQIKKTRKIDRLHKLLQDAGITYKTTLQKSRPGFLLFNFVAPMVKGKGFSNAWWGATQEQLCVVASELVHWDGTARKAKGCGFSSFKKADADFAQYAYSAAKSRASLSFKTRLLRGKPSTEYRVHASAGQLVAGLYGLNGQQRADNVTREPSPDGFKYCFMVPSTFLLLRRNGCIFATGNTGKTWAALWSWDWLKENKLTNRLLIVAPLSTLRFTWLHDIYATIRHRQAVVLHGDRLQRLKLLETPDADIFIINHDGIKVIYDELKARTDIDAVVIDELAVFRNGGRKGSRYNRMLGLTKEKNFVWGMTGSPMPQAPTDVWAQCTIVTPASVPKYFSHVREQLMVRKSTHKWVPKEDALENALKYMQPAVRFSLDDVTELPPLIERFIDVEMTEEQKKAYQAIVRVCQAMVDNKQINALNAATAMGKLMQIAGGYVYADGREVATMDNEPRIKVLIDSISGAERPVIVFVPYLHALEGIAKAFDAAGITYRTVYGQTKNREAIFSDFQSRGLFKVLLAHPLTMSHGLNLQRASTTIWFLPITSLDTYEQANARIRRVGQLHKQEIIHLVSSPVERRVYNLLRGKQTVQDKFLALLASNTLALGAAA